VRATNAIPSVVGSGTAFTDTAAASETFGDDAIPATFRAPA